jgi:hypothetical protein
MRKSQVLMGFTLAVIAQTACSFEHKEETLIPTAPAPVTTTSNPQKSAAAQPAGNVER